MPGLASLQSKPSAAPDPVQLVAHDTSFCPATLTHLPLEHWLSRAQRQAWPKAVHVPPAVLHPPAVHEYLVAAEIGQPWAPQPSAAQGPASPPPSGPPPGRHP